MKRHYLISNITFNDAKGEEHREGEGVRLGKGILPPNLDKKEGFTMEVDIRQRKVMGECLKGEGGICGGPIKCVIKICPSLHMYVYQNSYWLTCHFDINMALA